MLLLIFYLSLAICVSFLCSVAEAVLLSVRPAYASALSKKGTKGGRALMQLQSNIDRPLAAILILNTIAHTVGAAGVGAQAAEIFGSAYIAVISGVLTLLILVLSEIIPKTLGAAHWQSLAPGVAVILLWVTKALLPLVWLSEKLTKAISPKGVSAFTFSRDEMAAMAQIGAEEGILNEKERKVVANLMRLHRLSVKDIMSPRAVMFMQNEDRLVRDFFLEHGDKPFSRIPVFKGGADDITGYVLKQDLLIAQAKDEFDRKLSEFRRELKVMPSTVSAAQAYDTLMRNRGHIVLIVDEYGTSQGILTLEDVLETLIGLEITDELDTVEDLQKLARSRWKERMQALGIEPESWSS
ncbi:CNNM domain-containing protein [Kordiimonas sp.]|uniref:CNNM domain-containing protein n=1 Tax=Kordiimonas sp. TaxID=1970157 RepID=UPI003A943EF0